MARTPNPALAISISNVVHRERTARELTLAELADRADMSPSTIWRVEAGEGDTQFATLRAIATGLGLTTVELVRLIETEI